MELKKLKTRLKTTRRGHKLLKDKCDELMRRFLETVREDKELRARVESQFGEIYGGLSVAAATTSTKELTESLMLPKREGELKVEMKNVMSVLTPTFDFEISESGGAEGYNYGFAFTSGELDRSLQALAGMLGDLVRMAELEKTAQLLCDEIEKTRRRVNAMEYIMIPQLETTIKRITMKLDENERGNLTRLMKVKDMMVKEQIEENRRRAEEDAVV